MSICVSIVLLLCLIITVTEAQPPPASVQNLVPLVLSRASRTWLNGLLRPPPGGRKLRREIRLLTDAERMNCFDIINRLKRDTNGGTIRPSKYDVIANLHESTAARGAHLGAAFWGWHRIYTIMFENAMSELDPNITIPYWDNTIDQPVGADSIMFSGRFFGSHRGPPGTRMPVQDGPFAFWRTPTGILTREIGPQGGALMTPMDLQLVFRQRRLAAISYPGVTPWNLEELHNRAHMWIGGHMRRTETSSRDPIFFFLHSYYDCVWEHFRDLQKLSGIDPGTDYPMVNFGGPEFAPNARLGLGRYRNRDAVSNIFAENYFFCERFPECRTSGSCGSPYLRCINGRCISERRRRNTFSPFTNGFFPGAPNPMRRFWGTTNGFRPFTQRVVGTNMV